MIIATPALRRAFVHWSAVAGLVAALAVGGFAGGLPPGAAAQSGATARDGASPGGQQHTAGRLTAPASAVLLAKRGGGGATQPAPSAVVAEFALRRPFTASWPVSVTEASPRGVRAQIERGRGPPRRSS
jgi:hypothetical protein